MGARTGSGFWFVGSAKKQVGIVFLLISLALHGCAFNPVDQENQSQPGQTADNLFDLIAQAEAAYNRKQWSDASALYQEVLALIPDDPYTWFRLGNTLTQSGEYYKAVFAFETSLKHDAKQTKPWFNLSTAHLLGAQLATLRALDSMDVGDVARDDMQSRLNTLSILLQ